MILEEIAERTRQRVAEQKQKISLEEMREKALSMETNQDFPFLSALKQEDIAFICEVKKASPSKGVIASDFPYIQIAKEYEDAGAAAISVLTEPYYFQGDNAYLREIVDVVRIPVLRKDFTVDEYMIYEAKVIGASAILLICAILSQEELNHYLSVAHSLGLSVIVEAHDASEVQMALDSGAGIIGVNNRDLKTFEVDINNSARYRNMVPEHIVFVSESGIKTPEDVQKLRKNGTNAVIIIFAFTLRSVWVVTAPTDVPFTWTSFTLYPAAAVMVKVTLSPSATSVLSAVIVPFATDWTVTV